MRRGWGLVFAIVASGCPLDSGGLGVTSGSSSTTSGGMGSSTGEGPGPSPDPSSDSTASRPEDTSTTGSTGSTSSSDSTGAPPPSARSCAEILALDPAAPTGSHVILRARDDEEIEVHCEMELDGGGWTLIARSRADQEGGPFGWGQTRGTLGDEDSPYSLNVVDVGLPFTEILVTRRMGFATPAHDAYVIAVPVGFVGDYGNEALQHMSTRTVLGTCDPTPPPTMLSWVGYTDREGSFFLRDNGGNDSWGLQPHRFRTFYNDCAQGGDLNGRQGALFVR